MISYAPIIDTHILSSNNRAYIYFSHHPAAMKSDKGNICIQFKNSSGEESTSIKLKPEEISNLKTNNCCQVLKAIPDNIELGEYFQARIAYYTIEVVEDAGGIKFEKMIPGSYSAWGVGRSCASYRLETGYFDSARPTYELQAEGSFRQAEPIMAYRFQLLTYGSTQLDEDQVEIIEDSGWLHDMKDNSNNDRYIFNMTYTPKTDTVSPKSGIYDIKWSIKTYNSFEQSITKDTTPSQAFENKSEYTCSQDALAKEHGYVMVNFDDNDVSGSLKRRSSNNTNWEFITNITQMTTYKDFTIEQGQTYEYALDVGGTSQGVTRNLFVKPITTDFDSIFLADEDRQLRIAFNPEVSTFKEIILETKQDTIGGKYPYFFRNGQVRYKEIPLSGLLSYHLDSNHFFLPATSEAENINMRTSTGSNNDTTMPDDDTTISDTHFNLTNDNFYKEREFKLEVLKWLNNGKPKYLRTPAEGNYVVRLTNVSLRPEKTLGGMLHSFSATAYEIADCWSDVCDIPICQGVINREQLSV